jgi:hypothetical protein
MAVATSKFLILLEVIPAFSPKEDNIGATKYLFCFTTWQKFMENDYSEGSARKPSSNYRPPSEAPLKRILSPKFFTNLY